jgi:hypothetical protein
MGRSRLTYLAEKKANRIRSLTGFSDPLAVLHPLEVASALGIVVMDPGDVPGLCMSTLLKLLSSESNSWSGLTIPLPDSKCVVILNPTHSRLRRNATLMEEICHIVLAHEPTLITNVDGESVVLRVWDKAQEQEAYRVASAALVPYEGLRTMIESGLDSQQIARHYQVSQDLVEFRIKVNGLWKKYQRLLGKV